MKTCINLFAIVICLFITLFPASAQNNKVQKEKQEEGIEAKLKREAWIESMHKAEPGVNWQILDKETRLSKINIKTNKINEMILSGKEPAEILDNDVIAGNVKGIWTERGSNNLAGRIHIANVDFERNLIYAGSAGGNVWRGSLNGESWTCLNNSIKINDIRAIFTFNSNNQNRIVVAGNGVGVIQYTTNEGLTWEKSTGMDNVSNSGGNVIRLIAMSDKKSLYALCYEYDYDEEQVWSQFISVYYSNNYADSFIRIYKIKSKPNWCDIWASTDYETGLYFYDKDEIYLLRNDGSTESINDMITGEFTEDYFNYRLQGTVVNGNVSLRLSRFRSDIGRTTFYSSEDAGRNWGIMGTLSCDDEGYKTCYPFERNSFAISKLDPDIMLWGGVDVHRTTNGGTSWSKINNWYEYYDDEENKLHADIPGIVFIKIPGEQSELTFIGTDGGLYKSTDQCKTVKNIAMNGLNVSQYYSTYTCSRQGNTQPVFAGAQDQGFQRCLDATNNDNTFTFSQVISGDYGHLTSSDGGTHLWAVYPGFVVFFKNLNKEGYGYSESTWDYSGDGWLWLPYTVADPTNPTVAYIAGAGPDNTANVWKLTYNGSEIEREMLPFDFKQGDWSSLSAVAVSSVEPSTMYALTSNGSFFYSTNSGNDWEKNNEFTGLYGHYFYGTAIVTSKLTKGLLYVAGSGYSTHNAYVSTDAGRSFTPITDGLPSTLVFDLTLSADEKFLFAATETGPYIYVVEHKKWYDLSGLNSPDQVFWSVEFVNETNTARFGTYGRGIWDFTIKEIVSVVDKQEDSNAKISISVTPTTVVDNCRISVQSDAVSNATVRIYDLEGRVVKELFDGRLESFEFMWNGTSSNGNRLPAGDYMVVVSANGNSHYAKIKIIN